LFGFVIDLYRNIIRCNEVVRESGTKAGLIGPELEGKTFGIIGAGAIGTRVARIAQAFGCRTLAYSRTKKDIDGLEFVGLDTLMAESDIVSVHVPQTKETTGLINSEKIALMKKDAVFINTARGPIVDSQALADALNESRIAGAAVLRRCWTLWKSSFTSFAERSMHFISPGSSSASSVSYEKRHMPNDA
jgi:phosphoglycerate dehydrogenase-like enzyme